jgi:membrane protein YqaA with SNARE-associated domain
MNPALAAAGWLFGYAFLSNVALAVLPHEPAVIWYGARLGVWPTALVATAGTVVAALVDHRLFVPLINRAAERRAPSQGANWPERVFRRSPFAVIALSGLTPLPFFPFKALALTTGYPLAKYAGAVAARSLPRYALLAWLGASVRLPVWLYAALFGLLLVPSLRMVLWPRSTRAAS